MNNPEEEIEFEIKLGRNVKTAGKNVSTYFEKKKS